MLLQLHDFIRSLSSEIKIALIYMQAEFSQVRVLTTCQKTA